MQIERDGGFVHVNGERYWLSTWERDGKIVCKQVVNDYTNGVALKVILKKYGVTANTVQKLVRSEGIPLRKKGWHWGDGKKRTQKESKSKRNNKEAPRCVICGVFILQGESYCSPNCRRIAQSIREGGTRQLAELMNA